jgi:hypothetical protein
MARNYKLFYNETRRIKETACGQFPTTEQCSRIILYFVPKNLIKSFVTLLSHSREVPEHFLKVGHENFLPQPSRFILRRVNKANSIYQRFHVRPYVRTKQGHSQHNEF